ncbi:rna-directed dna polymerase from mobile element jockey-like protein, partial [Lasius niger]
MLSPTKNSTIMEEGLHTDEEELIRETDWILKKNKKTTKKRKAKGSPRIHTEEVVRYTGNPMRKDTANKKKTQLAPPPIMVSGVKTFSKLKSIAQQAAKKDCKYISYNNNIWKLNVVEIDTYRAITDALNKKKVQWHSYENKASKPIKAFGHTQKYCMRDFVCVKCADKYPTASCPFSKDQKAKCDNCRTDKNPQNLEVKQPAAMENKDNPRTFPQVPKNNRKKRAKNVRKEDSNINQKAKSLKSEITAKDLKKSKVKLRDFVCYHTPHPADTARRGSAVLVRNHIQHYEDAEYGNLLQVITIMIQARNKELKVAAIYCPPRNFPTREDYINLFKILVTISSLEETTMRNTYWGSRLITGRGKELYLAGKKYKSEFISSDSPTYWPSNPIKTPDLIDFFIVKEISSNYIIVE